MSSSNQEDPVFCVDAPTAPEGAVGITGVLEGDGIYGTSPPYCSFLVYFII